MTSTWLGEDQITGKSIKFPGRVITCVSELPGSNGFAFGDENGWLLFSGIDGPLLSTEPMRVIESDRAMNQIAFNQFEGRNHIAACSARDTAILEVSRKWERIGSLKSPDGAHTIRATRWGGFLAPLGPAGLAHYFPVPGGEFASGFLCFEDSRPYFYSACRIGLTVDGREQWACAGRSSGVTTIAVSEKGDLKVIRSFKPMSTPRDYIAVWSIGNEEMPYAAISLTSDRKVDFSKDITEDSTPLTWEPPAIQGVAYSMFAADGSLFVLTSAGIYVCVDLVKSFLEGTLKPGNTRTKMRYIEMDVIDFALLYRKWMLILLHDSVLRVDVGDLLKSPCSGAAQLTAGELSPFEASTFEPIWRDICVGASEFALVS